MDPRPVMHGIPGPTVKFEAEDPKDEVRIKTPLDMPVEELDKPEMNKPEIEQPKEILSREVVSDIEEKYEPAVVNKEIVETPPKFDPGEVKGPIKTGLKPMAPINEIDKPEIEEPEISSTPEVDDYLKDRFNPDADPEADDKPVFMRSSDTDIGKEISGVTKLSEPIVKILAKQGYLTEDTSRAELLQVPEYQILLFIINNHPVPLEEIEEKTDVSSISLALSNLQADGLVEQTNDYRWTISQKVESNIN
ncbi:MAG: MarR family transcriptional regulator [Candidatus Heimdallarchaeota archaeon]|nr:MarR family transcriptional regulator [Candidatus Heimdallarchaeota archaeon]